MISVQNRLQQLSGSRNLLVFGFIFFFAITLSSCGVFGKSKYDRDTVKTHPPIDKPTKVDTTRWTKLPEDKFPPITSDEKSEEEAEYETILKYSYRVAAFIPFEINKMDLNVENSNDLRSLKYLHYYAGMQLAMEQLKEEDVRLTLDVFDSEESKSRIEQILDQQLPQETDAIMGPIKKECLVTLAEFGKENRMPIISPWYSSQSVAKENPYYIQINPFLTEHYHAITEHALEEFSKDQIFLVGRENTRDTDRFKYFQETAEIILDEKEALKTFTFDQDSLSAEFEIIKAKLLDDKATVFILPNYSSRDAQFIYDFIRRINVEKLDHEVYVYGMPVMASMNKLSYDYLVNMNVRIVMSRFVDVSGPLEKRFQSDFFEEYNCFPMDEAYEGYDNLLFLGRALKRYGTGFVRKLDQDSLEYLSTRFNIQPVMTSNNVEDQSIEYFENQNLRIIQFVENQFQTLK